jgi:hypothetical protein
MVAKRDLLIAPVGEGALILALAAIGWAASWPFVFASLGPTAYEIVEKPESKSARPYNVIAGHLVGLGAGFFALWVLDAWASPKVMTSGFVAAPRIWAAVVAATLTAGITLMIRASQPASLATALLISLGAMQTGRDAVAIVVGVLLVAAIGEPLRWLRETHPTLSKPSS